MSKPASVDIGCRVVAEYVDDVSPAELTSSYVSTGEVERPSVVAEFVDDTEAAIESKVFTVLFRDNRRVSVRGHVLKFVENRANPSDCGSYGILIRTAGGDQLVGLFRASEVAGVFTGDLPSLNESA